MEIGAGERRILRELLRAGERGLSERDVLTALYIKWRDCERRVERGMRQSYVKKVLRDLRSALEDCGVHVVAIEYNRRRPVRWMITTAAEPEVPRVPLPHVVSEPRLLAALGEMTRMQNILVRHIAATAERGLGSRELMELAYPPGSMRPAEPNNAISASLTEARVVLARHHLAIVTRPAAGPRVRRYLVRTR